MTSRSTSLTSASATTTRCTRASNAKGEPREDTMGIPDEVTLEGFWEELSDQENPVFQAQSLFESFCRFTITRTNRLIEHPRSPWQQTQEPAAPAELRQVASIGAPERDLQF